MTPEHGHVLVVDDNRMNLIKLARSLEQQGHRVASAEDGERALAMLAATQYDVVLLDIVMPGLDGFQVLERIKGDKTLRDVPVIVISAVDEVDSAVRCIEMGAEDYLPKPFNPVLLRARLNASLQKKKLRDLEKAYLQQDLMLRQNEKLATLGRLSAGMAHELNNPAAAARGGARQLRENFARLEGSYLRIARLGLPDAELATLLALGELAKERARTPAKLDALARGDQEAELEAWLEARGVENPWEIAPALTNLGFDCDGLERNISNFRPEQMADVIEWLNSAYVTYSLLEQIGQGAERISDIVAALKSYTYMDQAPVQEIDLRVGLDSTLVMLQSRLKEGVTVRRDYAPDLPLIPAYGSELNQVWTNIIDNAIDAMSGQGALEIRASSDEDCVIVEIQDSGDGIPDEVLPRIFDPFFTTKPPGRGSGMGLSISHSIVTQKHGGRIEAESAPGRTVFRVRLPRVPLAPTDS